MDLSGYERRLAQRRSTYGEHIMRLLHYHGPANFSELAEALADTGARISDIVDWMAGARRAGLVENTPGPHADGRPRRVRLTSRGSEVAVYDHRGRERRARPGGAPSDERAA